MRAEREVRQYFSNADGYPHSQSVRPVRYCRIMLLKVIGYAAGTLTTLAFVPQVVRTWRTRSTGDLSTGMLLAFSAGVALWLIYGLGLRAWPIIMANAVTLLFALVLLAFKLANQLAMRAGPVPLSRRPQSVPPLARSPLFLHDTGRNPESPGEGPGRSWRCNHL